LRTLNGRPIVGGNVVELAPHYDPTSNTALVSVAMLFALAAFARSG
tara:strand:+ start:423 stop:560 length:138 start_codon:yes stop_codon:yes gene_type:complete